MILWCYDIILNKYDIMLTVKPKSFCKTSTIKTGMIPLPRASFKRIPSKTLLEIANILSKMNFFMNLI